MARRVVPGVDLDYHLLAFDAAGRERREPDGSLGSDRLLERVRTGQVTDVFIASHGWMGDVPAAVGQYDRWFSRVARQPADRAALVARVGAFSPLVVGLHWPSLPWGDERLPAAGGLLGGDPSALEGDEFDQEDQLDVEQLVDLYATRIADTPAARRALRVVLGARPDAGDLLPPEVARAYEQLFTEAGPDAGALTSAPGDDQEGFDPRLIIEQALDETDAPAGPGLLGGDARRWSPLEALRMPLRQLSFWAMKKRGRLFGEGAAHDLVRRAQLAAPALRVHLMGHSFGCIVVTGAVAGSPGGAGLVRPVQTLYLVQGALSLWSFASDIPQAPGLTGYYRRVLDDRLVSGAVVTTRSRHDTALRVFYPRGAALARQLLLDESYPAYGGLGAYGARGVADARDSPVLPTTLEYGFAPESLWNLDASEVITSGGGPAGAHNDIDHDQLAHVLWQAVTAAV